MGEICKHAVGKQNSFPTLEHKENEEGKIVARLGRVADMIKETVVIIGAKRVIIVRHDIGESIRNVSTSDKFLGLARLVAQQEEGKYDATKEPFARC